MRIQLLGISRAIQIFLSALFKIAGIVLCSFNQKYPTEKVKSLCLK